MYFANRLNRSRLVVHFCKSLWSLAAFVSLLSSSLLPEPNYSANFDIFAFLHSCLLPIFNGQIAFWFCRLSRQSKSPSPKILAAFTPFCGQRGWKSPVSSCFLWRLKKTNLESWPSCPKKELAKKDLQLMSPGRWAARTILLSQLLFSLQQKHSLRRGSRPLINGEKWIANASTSQPAHMLANSAPVGNTNPIFKPDWTPRFRPTSANPDFP